MGFACDCQMYKSLWTISLEDDVNHCHVSDPS